MLTETFVGSKDILTILFQENYCSKITIKERIMLQTNSLRPATTKRQSLSSSSRHKLWQIPQAYHCSIIGNCLSRKDLRILNKKKLFNFEKGLCDYEVHKALSSEADKRSEQSRALHKYLDNKHKVALKKYSACKQAEEIRKRWEDDLDKGDVAGAFWAIVTHPANEPQLISDVYGECHMMSFDVFSKQLKENRTTQTLQNQVLQLQKQLQDKQQRNDQLLTKTKELQKELQQAKTQIRLDSTLIKNLTKSNDNLKGRFEKLKHIQRQNNQHQQLLVEKQKNKDLISNLISISKDANLKQELFNLAQAKAERLDVLRVTLQRQNKEKQNEINNIKTALIFNKQKRQPCSDCNTYQAPCETCENLYTEKCQGPDLCGKTVLYVGGLHKMIPLYKELIENHGGKFVHHDGGKENSRQLLPKLLGGADAVVCPVDCVSHDACKCVKKICKRYEKPFVMMRSSGLSSLAKGLNNIC